MNTVMAEEARVAALRSYGLLDAPRPAALDELTRLTTTLVGTPIALVTLIDENRQWFAGNTGLGLDATARDLSFCAHTLTPRTPLIVPDARLDSRFVANGLVTGAPWIRSYAGAPLIDEDGHALGAVCAIGDEPRDFSDREIDALTLLAGQASGHLAAIRSRLRLIELGDALAQAVRREEDLVATVSHELRTPVAAIQGYLELLTDDAALAPYGRLIDPIRRNGERLVRMVDHLLEGTADAKMTQATPTPIGTVVAAAVAGTSAVAASRDVTVTVTGDGRTVVGGADPARLAQAVEQLVRNAVLFSAPGGSVRVTMRRADATIVEVTDSGAGIPADELPHVTERFFRGRHARKQAVPGMGLGLTIAAGIASAHGGFLQMSSPGAGRGTTARLGL
ncbi:GAF domain-containing sensor histidine kinase [Symbioplanes lichenis]|uniref:GAF domain-containing sensor histidine kinase n=1 Tax=Symbioplanes lichenis TaxID=1629072 RepID=UPI0027389BCE|nr:GAF domain-containing sensor histidine kinase [Actinoplanes lichenis]